LFLKHQNSSISVTETSYANLFMTTESQQPGILTPSTAQMLRLKPIPYLLDPMQCTTVCWPLRHMLMK